MRSQAEGLVQRASRLDHELRAHVARAHVGPEVGFAIGVHVAGRQRRQRVL